jgi:hypothetical protein
VIDEIEEVLRGPVDYRLLSLLESEAADKPAFARQVAEAYARQAIEIERRLPAKPSDRDLVRRVAAATLATRAVRLAGSVEDRRDLIEALGESGAASLMRALLLEVGDLAVIACGSSVWREERDAAGRMLLDAAAIEPSTPASMAVEDTAFATIARC